MYRILIMKQPTFAYQPLSSSQSFCIVLLSLVYGPQPCVYICGIFFLDFYLILAIVVLSNCGGWVNAVGYFRNLKIKEQRRNQGQEAVSVSVIKLSHG